MRRISPIRYRSRTALLMLGTLVFPAVPQAFAAGAASDDERPPFDWSIGLRGQYQLDNGVGSYEAIVAPAASINLDSARGQTTLNASGEFATDSFTDVRFIALRLGASTTYALDPDTDFTGSTDLSLIQLQPDDTTLPANTAVPPLELTGNGLASVKRNLGLFDATATVNGQRFIEGPTTLDDASVIDNTSLSYWLGNAELRLGYEMSPLLSVFVDGAESYQKFDAPSPALAVFLDGRTTTLRGGFSYTQDSTFSAEVSAGRAWLDYDDPAVTDSAGWVYDASVSYNPDETLNLTGSFNTTIGSSSTVAGDTDVGYTLSGEAKYAVNPWLTLRGTAGWTRVDTLGSGDIATGYTVGAGLDFSSSRHSVWSADYAFAHSDPATGIPVDTHTVTVGLTIKR